MTTSTIIDTKIYTDEELALLDRTRIPHHVAIIMDGNRRWAKQRGLPPMAGHWQGAEVITKIVRAASELGIKVLTVYSFSTENWGRPTDEVNSLMDLFKAYLIGQRDRMIREGVKLGAIGNLQKLPPDLLATLDEVQRATQHCDTIDLVLAMNYGGRDDIRRAALAMAEDLSTGKIQKNEVNEEVFAEYLDTAKWGDPDLLIRTSGQQRVSNFLLWQISYSEFFVTPVLLPDFSERDLLEAVLDYQKRERRWGGP